MNNVIKKKKSIKINKNKDLLFLNKIKQESLIITINNLNLNIHKLIYSKIKSNNELICFIPDNDKAAILKNKFKKPNIIIINSPFEQNNLKNKIADLIISYDLLKTKNKRCLTEILKIAKKDCHISFNEKISIYTKVKSNNNQNENNFDTSIKNIKKNLNYLKNFNYTIKIYSENKFELKIEKNINKLIDFKNVLYNINNNKKNIQLDLIIEGELNK